MTQIVNLPLNGSLVDSKSGAVGSFLRDSVAWYMDENNVMQEVAADTPRFAGRPQETFVNYVYPSRDTIAEGVGGWTDSYTPAYTYDVEGYDGQLKAITIADESTDGNSSINFDGIAIEDDGEAHYASFYMKKTYGTPTHFALVQFYCTNGGTSTSVNINLNSTTGVSNHVRCTSEDAGDWWRFTVYTTNNSSGNTSLNLRLFPATGTIWGLTDKTTTGSQTYDQIQVETYVDASGPPIETTTGPTRFRGTSSPALLLEGPGPNVCLQRRNFDHASWVKGSSPVLTQDQIGIDGVANSAWSFEDNSVTNFETIEQDIAVPDDSNTHTASIFIKKESGVSKVFEMKLILTGGTGTSTYGDIDVATGTVYKRSDSGSDDNVWSEDYGDWWRFNVTCTNNTSGNTTARITLYAAISDTLETTDATVAHTVVIDQAQLELNQSYASSPMVTTALGSDLVTNGDFTTDTTGWLTARSTITVVSGECQVTATDNTGYAYQPVTTVAGSVYKLSFDYWNTVGDLAQFQLLDAVEGEIIAVHDLPDTQVSSTITYYFTALGTNTRPFLIAKSNTDITYFDNVVIQEVPGARATEAGVADTSGVQWDLDDFGVVGHNLISNSYFASAQTGWSAIGSAAATWDFTGGNAAVELDGAGSAVLYQTVDEQPGWFDISIDISNLSTSAGAFNLYYFDNPTWGAIGTITGNGTWTFRTWIPVAWTRLTVGHVGGDGADGDTWTVDNFTCKSVTDSLTSILEEQLGDDLVTNGDFADDSDWVKNDWLIGGGVASIDGSQTGASFLQQIDVASDTDTDAIYKISFDYTRTAGELEVRWGADGANYAYSHVHVPAADDSYVYYMSVPPSGSNPGHLNFRANVDFIGTLDNVVVTKVINDSRGTAVVDWIPGVDSDDVSEADQGLISLTSATRFMYYKSDVETLHMWDGSTTSTEAAVDVVRNTQYRLYARWGIDNSNVRQMAIGWIVSGTATDGSVVDYDGAFPLSELFLALKGTWGQQFTNIQFYDEPLTDAQLESPSLGKAGNGMNFNKRFMGE